MIDVKETPNNQNIQNDVMRSCCFVCDFRAFLFVAQFIFSMVIFAVSVAMIITHNNEALFISLLSLVVGVWLPTPQHPNPTTDKST